MLSQRLHYVGCFGRFWLEALKLFLRRLNCDSNRASPMDRNQLEVLMAGLRGLRADLEKQEAQIVNGLAVLQGLEQEVKKCVEVMTCLQSSTTSDLEFTRNTIGPLGNY